MVESRLFDGLGWSVASCGLLINGGLAEGILLR